MYLSTFVEENINSPAEMIIKSLFILAFITPKDDTNLKIKYSDYRSELEQIRYNSIVSKYCILSIVNPNGWNLITKNLPEPNKRKGLEEDFLMVEMETLYNYFQIVNVISNTISLN